jgi:xanthine dehydrogenase accessory factor
MNDQILSALLESLEKRDPVALVSITEAEGAAEGALGSHRVVWLDATREPLGDLHLGELSNLQAQIDADARTALRERAHRHVHYAQAGGRVKAFIEVQVRPPHLVIVGAGHIAVPLASVASLCDFEVTVLDDRAQYANRARFPAADRVIAGPFQEELRNLRRIGRLDNHTYIVMVTRGHQYDVESLIEVMDDPLAYVGMIGSQRRVRAVFELLEREQKIPAEKFDHVYAPVGLDIGARTPAEIAVCIMAEIINVMRGGPARSMSEQIRLERQARRQRVAQTAR